VVSFSSLGMRGLSKDEKNNEMMTKSKAPIKKSKTWTQAEKYASPIGQR